MVIKNRRGRAKRNRVYTSNEVRLLYKITPNTLTAWRKLGLSSSDNKRPSVFRGAELNRFQADLHKSRGVDLKQEMFLCLICKAAVVPAIGSFDFSDMLESGRCNVRALCAFCGGRLRKGRNATQCDELKEFADSQIKEDCEDEANCAVHARFGISDRDVSSSYRNGNDRLLHEWHSTMIRLAENSIDAHLVAIREFERFLGETRLENVTIIQVTEYVKQLIGRLVSDENSLTKSTIQHRASHLRGFYQWLCKHPGIAIKDLRILDCFDLPRKLDSSTEMSISTRCPSREEMCLMIEGMPSKTFIEKRQRAIVALAALTGVRASALISLRFSSLDPKEQVVRQYVKEGVRTKNGKDMFTVYFPVLKEFAFVVSDWYELLQMQGLKGEDALFPNQRDLDEIGEHGYIRKRKIPVMRTQRAVTDAFYTASFGIGERFNPHSVRHLLAAERFNYCKNEKELKAWSRNLGHESEQITNDHYAKMGDVEAGQIISVIEETREEKSQTDDRIHSLFVLGRLDVDSPEWERGVMLHRERSKSG